MSLPLASFHLVGLYMFPREGTPPSALQSPGMLVHVCIQGRLSIPPSVFLFSAGARGPGPGAPITDIRQKTELGALMLLGFCSEIKANII